jgi:8-amino-7-oxononanoate synthase
MVGSPAAERLAIAGREVLNLSSNNYLGLAAHPRVIGAAREALATFGVGAGASRLISGHQLPHEEIEADLAAYKQAPAARVFSSGYAACTGVIGALAGPRDAIFADALVHASLIDGARLSRARLRVFRHAEPAHLEALLEETPRRGRALVVTDGVFSMDGDVAPLEKLADVADRHGALLVVDDAHGTGVLGPDGRGSVESRCLADRVPVRIGTLSKALGGQGGFVVGSEELADLLLHRGRSFVYSTAIAPALCAAARAALRLVREEPERRDRLHANARVLRAGLAGRGYRLAGTPEVPMAVVLLGRPGAALRLSERLLAAGVLAPAIRPPTVPAGTSRIRLTPMATHTADDMERVVAAFPDASEVGAWTS